MIEVINMSVHNKDGLIVVAPDGSVWMTLDRPWWDPVGWARWYGLCGKRAWLIIGTANGKVRVKAVRLSSWKLDM